MMGEEGRGALDSEEKERENKRERREHVKAGRGSMVIYQQLEQLSKPDAGRRSIQVGLVVAC